MPTVVHETCQTCLLERAGAIHVEEVNEIERQRGSSIEYWVVGMPNYLRAKLIKCFGAKLSVSPTIVSDLEMIAIEGITGAFPTVARKTRAGR